MAEGKSFKSSVTIIVLGASGDLASKKTFPALFKLYSQGLLPPQTRVLGYARSDLSREQFHEKVSKHFDLIGPHNRTEADEFLKLTEYVRGAYDKPEEFQHLDKVIAEGEAKMDRSNRLFYLALPPSQFAPVAAQIKHNCYLNPDKGLVRVIIEKPFGHDLASSRELQKDLAPLFSEEEIYRIDHYLGKEMVKNLLIVRFANMFLTGVWNNHFISSVQITFKEPFGTEGRGGYFDDIGIIRDVMQNHLLQVLSLVAMERPARDNPEDIRDEKVKVLKAIDPITPDQVILGQYVGSEDGKKPGYLDDDSIKNRESKTPTFAAMCLRINNERWDGVPFILKAGKALDKPKVEIRIQFRSIPKHSFQTEVGRNELVLLVQPHEAIYMKINAKLPGLGYEPVVTDLDMSYHRRFSNLQIPQAYEALILDCINGDHSNFVRDDELDEAWKIFTPLLHTIDRGDVNVEKYPYGSRGPPSVDKFVQDLGYVRTSAEKSYSWPVQRGNL